MLKFEDVAALAVYMFEKLDNKDNLVSVISNKEMTVKIMKELLDYDNVILNSCKIDYTEDYSREYMISLFDDTDSENWYVSVEKCYLSENNRYISTEGYVLFHEDANSRALIDMQNNKFMPLSAHDWFVISDDIDEDDYKEENDAEDIDHDPEPDDEDTGSGYSVTVNVDLDTEEAEKIIRSMKKEMKQELSGMFDMLYRPYLYEYRPLLMRLFC